MCTHCLPSCDEEDPTPDPLSIKCPFCGATAGYPCMEGTITPQAQTVCWEVAPHRQRIEASNENTHQSLDKAPK